MGITLFELLTGARPFQGDGDAEVIAKILEHPPLRLDQFRDDVPEGLQAIVEKSLAKERDDRYAGAQEMQAEIEALLVKLGQVVRGAEIAAFVDQVVPRESDPVAVSDGDSLDIPRAAQAPPGRTSTAAESPQAVLPPRRRRWRRCAGPATRGATRDGRDPNRARRRSRGRGRQSAGDGGGSPRDRGALAPAADACHAHGSRRARRRAHHRGHGSRLAGPSSASRPPSTRPTRDVEPAPSTSMLDALTPNQRLGLGIGLGVALVMFLAVIAGLGVFTHSEVERVPLPAAAPARH